MAKRFYAHEINPHYSAEHHDLVCEGYRWGVWASPTPAVSPHLYDFKVASAAAANRLVTELESHS